MDAPRPKPQHRYVRPRIAALRVARMAVERDDFISLSRNAGRMKVIPATGR
jgi:hypothetical protein